MQWGAGSLFCLKRVLAVYPELQCLFEQVWVAQQAHTDPILAHRFGIVANLSRVFEAVGWKWSEPLAVHTDWGMRVEFLSVDLGFWEHEVRRAARRMMWNALAKGIPKHVKLSLGIDTWATLRPSKRDTSEPSLLVPLCRARDYGLPLSFAHRRAPFVGRLKHAPACCGHVLLTKICAQSTGFVRVVVMWVSALSNEVR